MDFIHHILGVLGEIALLAGGAGFWLLYIYERGRRRW